MAKIKITKGELKVLIKEALNIDRGLLTESKKVNKVVNHPLYNIIKEELAKVKTAQAAKAKQTQKKTTQNVKSSEHVKSTKLVNKKQVQTESKSVNSKQKLNEGIKDVIVGSMMALASALGGKAVQAQTPVHLPIADTIVISGFNPANVKVQKNTGRDNMTMTVHNNISGANVTDETKAILDKAMGAVVKDEGTSIVITQNDKLKKIKTNTGVAQNNQVLVLNIHPNTKVTFQNDEKQGISFKQEGKKQTKKPLTEAQLNEDFKSWAIGGLMALASLVGGKAAAQSASQTSGAIKPLEKLSSLTLTGYDKGEVKVTKVKGSRITYRVFNDLQGGTIEPETEKKLENMMGVAIPNATFDTASNSFVIKNPNLQIVAGDYDGEGALFSRIQNKYGNEVVSNQRIEILVGEDAINPDFKLNFSQTAPTSGSASFK